MTKFRSINRDGLVWLAVEFNNKIIFLHPQGRVGDCIRPGQKMK